MPFPTVFPVLESARLRLRPLHTGDAPDLLKVFGDPVAMRYWSRLPMQEVEEAVARIERVLRGFESGDAISWAVAARGDDRLIGTLDLFRIELPHRRCECGYSLGTASWRQGYMSEILPLALDYAFGELGLHRVEADTDPRNSASVKLLQRLGFQREGMLRERWRVGAEVSDSAVFGLLAPEWQERQGREG